MAAVLKLSVRQLIAATPNTRILRLTLDRSFGFHAGQAVLMGLPGGTRRPYSIACAPEVARAERYLEFLLKVDASGAAGPHLGTLEALDQVEVEGPFGSFRFPEQPVERNFLFIAGGTGVAPLRAMLWHALLTSREARIGIIYSVRSPDDLAYGDELELLARDRKIDFRPTITGDAGPSWTGDRGRIDLQRLRPLIAAPETLCFVCGPPALLQDMPPLLRRLGISETRIRMEER
ncbi:MAG: FAD-dependent oxidoreductase [Acidobacteria bacterium]|nr:FAD-dependent oxidoreductase [Acidobacteriota bacterium]